MNALAVTAMAMPAFHCNISSSKPEQKLFTPKLLFQFCDEKTINKIGKDYGSKIGADYSQKKLKDMLAAGINISGSSGSDVEAYLDGKIKDNFSKGQTVISRGWVISVTEARQCALFSLQNFKR